VLDLLNSKQIDEAIQSKQTDAEAYAARPEIFTLFSLEVELKSTHGNRLIRYDDGTWSCTCNFFQEWGTCSHTMATALLLKDSFFLQPESEGREYGGG